MDFCRSTEQAGIITGSLYPKGNCSLSPSRELPPARNHNAFPKDFFPPFFVKRATNHACVPMLVLHNGRPTYSQYKDVVNTFFILSPNWKDHKYYLVVIGPAEIKDAPLQRIHTPKSHRHLEIIVWLTNIVNTATSRHRRQANKKNGTLLLRNRFVFGERSVPSCKHCTTPLEAIYGGYDAFIQNGVRANWLMPLACRAVG